MTDHYYAVIMAGGGGTRLWPLSRQSKPKQMLALFDERSMFQTAVDRILDIFPPERIFVVTVQEQAIALQQQHTKLPSENFLIEPTARGTASVIGLAAVVLQHIDPEAIMAVLGSDHYIADEALFRQLLQTAGEAAQQGYLVTLGIEPTFPSTGFGYIQRGDPVGEFNGHQIYKVKKFKEKPSQSQAEAMIADGQHDWNSGMFIWRVDRILAEIDRQMPDLYAGLQKIRQALVNPDSQAVVDQVWGDLENQTIDYGIMENAQNVVVLPAVGLGWSDVGSWDSLFDLLDGDEHGNIVMGGEHFGLDTTCSLIYMNQPRRLIVTIGVEDLVVVDTGDVVLVCDKAQAQRVRQVVRQLRDSGKEYL
jgi:mannose-1-phosphate guanylyltransferase